MFITHHFTSFFFSLMLLFSIGCFPPLLHSQDGETNCILTGPGSKPEEEVEGQVDDNKDRSDGPEKEDEYLENQRFNIPFLTQGQKMEVVLLGETGSGKSTFINTLMNFLFRKDLQNLEVVIPTKYFSKTMQGTKNTERDVKNQNQSQTSAPMAYRFRLPTNEATITVIDTPGLGDTRGINQDNNNLEEIFDHVGKLKNLAGLILFFNGTSARLTTSLQYASSRLKGIVPDRILDNMLIVFTNCREETCNLERHAIPFHIPDDRVFYMNNSAFSSNPAKWDGAVLRRLRMEWTDSQDTMRSILSTLARQSPRSAEEFMRMKELRSKIMRTLHNTRLKIGEIQSLYDGLKSAEQVAKEKGDMANQYANYTQKERVKKRKIIHDSSLPHSTICSEHTLLCHYHCGLNETKSTNQSVFSGCAAMKGDFCTVCGQNGYADCSYLNHYHDRCRIEEAYETVEKVLEDLKLKYEQTMQDSNMARNKANEFHAPIKMVENVMDSMKKEIQNECCELKKICSGFNFVNELMSMIHQLEKDAQSLQSVEARKKADQFIDSLKIMANSLSSSNSDANKLLLANSATQSLGLTELVKASKAADAKGTETKSTTEKSFFTKCAHGLQKRLGVPKGERWPRG